MTKLRIAAATLFGLALVVGLAVAGETLKSGPQEGTEVPGPFHPLNVTGENAGEKVCLFCKNGNNPVAMIFAREVSDNLTKLIKKIDATTAENKESKMGSFVVFLNDNEDLPRQLKEVAEKEGIKHTVLSVDNPAGPKAYKVAKEADVTVVLYTNHTVKVNRAFKKGDLQEKDIDTIVADVAKIVNKG
jgi:hypothetical protein